MNNFLEISIENAKNIMKNEINLHLSLIFKMETAYAMYTKCMFEMYKRQEKKLYCSHTYSSNDPMQGEEKCLLHDYYQITWNSTGNSYTFCIYFCTIKKTSTKTSPSSEINYNKISGIW